MLHRIGCAVFCVVFYSTICCPLVLSAASKETIMENDQVRFVFDAKPAPHLQKLVQKPSQINLLASPADQNLFTFVVEQPKGGLLTVESRTATSGDILASREGKGHRVVLTFSGLGPGGAMKATVIGRLGAGSPIARWSIDLDNPKGLKIVSVRFPYVMAAPAIGNSNDDFIVAPNLPGALIENPAAVWPKNYSVTWDYPGGQSAQFCSFQDRTAGVYVGSMDAVGCNRALSIAKQKNGFLLCQTYRLPDAPKAAKAGRWKCPYEVALGATSGTWQQTADLYKRWAIRQPWCEKTLERRDDVPDFWKHGPCVYTIEVRRYDPKTQACSGSYYSQLEENVKRLRQKIDGPVVPMLAGWENHRRWNAGEYFPIFDEAAAKPVLQKLIADGFHPFVFFSGLYYTYLNEGADAGSISSADRYADSYVIDQKIGKPKTFALTEHAGAWKRHSYEFCPSAPDTKKFFCDAIDRLHALGIDIMQMDQTVAGGSDPCYSDAHGHTPGVGPYQIRAFCDLLAAMHEHGKALSRDFVFTHEEVHENLIPYLDGFHTREYKESWWYRGAPGSRGIPLFSYLYHEYAIAYGGDSAGVSKMKNANHVREHAVNLVSGKTPGISVWSSQEATADADADQMKMVQNHSHLLKTEAWRFLMLGRMLHSLEFDAPPTTFETPVQKNGKWSNAPFVDKAVLTSSWESPEKLIGHCLVNVTGEKQQIRLKLDARNVPDWTTADVDLYRADRPDRCEHLAKKAALPYETVLDLSPYEAVFFVLRPSRD